MKDRKEVEEKSKAPYMQGWMAAKYSEMQEIQASSERRKSILERIENKEPTLILDPYKHGRELAIRTINREKDRQETKYRQGFHDTYQEMIHQKIETEEVDDEGPIDILAKIVEDIRYIHERLAMLEKYTQE